MQSKAAFLLFTTTTVPRTKVMQPVCAGAGEKRITLTQEERVREVSKPSDKQGKQY